MERIFGAQESDLSGFLTEPHAPCPKALSEPKILRYRRLSGHITSRYFNYLLESKRTKRETGSANGLNFSHYLGLTRGGTPLAVLSVAFSSDRQAPTVYLDDIYIGPAAGDEISSNQILIFRAFIKNVVLKNPALKGLETVRAFSQSSIRSAYLENLGFVYVNDPEREHVVFNRPGGREVLDFSIPYFRGRYQVLEYRIR